MQRNKSVALKRELLGKLSVARLSKNFIGTVFNIFEVSLSSGIDVCQ
jgi:hypothetical protein